MDTSVLPRQINRKIGRAMHDFDMLKDGDRVMVAVSGGVDSLVAAWVLKKWQLKAPIDYEIEAVYINNGYWRVGSGESAPELLIAAQLDTLGVPFTQIDRRVPETTEHQSCFSCSKSRRACLFEYARKIECNKLVLGHHKDDLVETFFINMLYSGNISTMLPRQDLFGGKLSLIRLLSYLEKKEVCHIAQIAGLVPVKNYCPRAGDTRRETVRNMLEKLYEEIPGAKSSVFASMGNVRTEYML